jgi:hypothetical protein
MVVREVSKVYELIKTHQPLFLLQPATTTTQMAQHLLSARRCEPSTSP